MSQSLQELLDTLQAAVDIKTFRKLDFFVPYPKQIQFFNFGGFKRERLLLAGNQIGKTEAGAYETALHLTGKYPDWWTGRRFSHAPRGWAAGQTSLVVRDASQKKLCGPPGVDALFGSGYIPKDDFIEKPNLARGISDGYDTLQVRHVSGGTSTLTFKSYEQGRTKFQADTLDFVWLDEEPGDDIYSECLARITSTQGMLYTTFTPLQGRTEVVLRFMESNSEDRAYVVMTMADVTHISEEDKRKIEAGYKPHERDSRIRGVPMMGEGKVFQIFEESITEPPIENVPLHWYKIWGVDFGIGHPFAAVLALWDKDNDVIHLHYGLRVSDALPVQHAKAMKVQGAQIPVAWPHDGLNRDKGTGVALATQYKSEGLLMLPDHAKWEDGSISVEAAIVEMIDRMQTGRFKVSSIMVEWLEEFRFYHRKEGLIVAVKNDLMDATIKIMMSKRFARAVALGNVGRRRRQTMAQGIDFDIFG